eukprot:2174996-Rhodomonas_salina.1
MRQSRAIPEPPCQHTHSLMPQLIGAQVEMSQRRALSEHTHQHPDSHCTNIVLPHVEVSQRLALPKHPRQPFRSLCTRHPICNSVAAQVQMNRELFGQALEVLCNAALTQQRAASVRKNNAAAVSNQILSQLAAHPQPRNHPLSRPKKLQQNWCERQKSAWRHRMR